MSGFIEGKNRGQSTLFPERIDDYVEEDRTARMIDVFVGSLDISDDGWDCDRPHKKRDSQCTIQVNK